MVYIYIYIYIYIYTTSLFVVTDRIQVVNISFGIDFSSSTHFHKDSEQTAEPFVPTSDVASTRSRSIPRRGPFGRIVLTTDVLEMI